MFAKMLDKHIFKGYNLGVLLRGESRTLDEHFL